MIKKVNEFEIEELVDVENLKKIILMGKEDFKTEFMICKFEKRKDKEFYFQEKQFLLNKDFVELNKEKLKKLNLLKV